MFDYPVFNINRVEHYQHVEQLIDHASQIIELNKKNINLIASFDELILPIEEAEARLMEEWSLLDHLQNVNNNNELREQHQKTSELLTHFQTKYSLDTDLMKLYQKAAEQPKLTEDQKLLLDHALINFKLAGVLLEETDKKKLFNINQEINELSEKFGNQLLDSTDQWVLSINEEEASGLNSNQLNYLKQIALEHKLTTACGLNLSPPCVQMILGDCTNRVLREKIYKANAHRASQFDETNPSYDNSLLACKILTLRQQEAQILGYESYRAYALTKRFAENVEEVSDFLDNLVQEIKPIAAQEIKKIEALAKQDGIEQLEAWDLGFYSEQLKKQTLLIHDEEIRQYFSLDRSLMIMLETFGSMYGFKTKLETDQNTWHKDVFLISLIDSQTNKPIGKIYFDLYARSNKRKGAWMNGARSRINYKEWKQDPIAYIVCNFRKDNPATLSFDDLQTLFHEFGHSLHHLLTQRALPSIAGIHQVPWDIVELPSQLNEQWCFEKEFLKNLSAHTETQEQLNDHLIDNLIKTRQFQASLFLLRQVEFATLDWNLYGDDQIDDVVSYWQELRKKIAVTPSIPTHAFPLSFSHSFDGGYAAGYYSYLWADAYVYQVYDRMLTYNSMEEAGTAFKNKFLAIGPSLSLKQSLHEFLGEKQSIKPLLKAYGITA
jgi:oligopeptidase A